MSMTIESLFDNLLNDWWARKDLNLEPTDYESAALTVELRAPRVYNILQDKYLVN